MNTEQKLLMMGRLGKAPDLRYTKDQKPICFLSVAEASGEDQKTIWHRVVVWGKQAELCSLYLKKGSELFVRGIMRFKEFTDNKGEIKKYQEINADLIGFSNL